MKTLLLIQLPVPQLNFPKQSGNIPLAGAYLKQVLKLNTGLKTEILPESISTWYSDSALISYIEKIKPDFIGFTIYCWNISRSIYLHNELKKRFSFISIAGGPEITKDNYLLINHPFNYILYGEGEVSFCHLMSQLTATETYPVSIEKTLYSPYLDNSFENFIEKTMFLETQRGCPYECGFCYYNKSRDKVIQFKEDDVLKAIQYAWDSPDINQVYLMDPSLNTRQNLKHLISKIIEINKNNKLSFYSEIRAESVNFEWAELFAKAGFKEFEVGLQSTNPKALEIMKRPSDLKAFLEGCKAMQYFDIVPKVDLIAGLPGDNPACFRDSVDFVYDNEIDENMQVFALSVLPGTHYRKTASYHHLEYQQQPPYYVQKTESFEWEDIFNSFRYAEKKLNINLFPAPCADLALKSIPTKTDKPFSKVHFSGECSEETVIQLSNNLCAPYQVIFDNSVQNIRFIKLVIQTFTQNNPFTPFEIIFFEPKLNHLEEIVENFSAHAKPSFLDNDMEYSSPVKVNCSYWLTIISSQSILCYKKHNTRQLFHWRNDTMPELSDLLKYSHLKGIYINNNCTVESLNNWQNRFESELNQDSSLNILTNLDFTPENFFSFHSEVNQRHWLKKFSAEEFCLDISHNIYHVTNDHL